jgi:hypothetical protein
MTPYISVSFSRRKLTGKELTAIVDTLNANKTEPFIFVDN